MVWGMEIPSTFGDFWPRGGFEGDNDTWFNRLDDYFNGGEMSAEKRALIEPSLRQSVQAYSLWASQKFSKEPGAEDDDGGPPFLPVEPHEVPKFYKAEKSSTSLGSMIALNFGMLAVDEDLKAVIERLEPGVHQFFPIEIRMPGEKVYPSQYYILLIGQYIDSFLPAESKEGSYKSYPDHPGYYTLATRPPGAMSGLALSKSVFGSAHLWRERGLNRRLTCLSDQLATEAKKGGLRLPKHHKLMEV